VAREKTASGIARPLEILRHYGGAAIVTPNFGRQCRVKVALGGGAGGRNMIIHFSLVVAFGAIAASGLTLQALQSFFG
jgi:hypothetical protein